MAAHSRARLSSTAAAQKMELPLFFLPNMMSLASLTLAARNPEPPESGWLAIMMRRCASLTFSSGADSRRPAGGGKAGQRESEWDKARPFKEWT